MVDWNGVAAISGSYGGTLIRARETGIRRSVETANVAVRIPAKSAAKIPQLNGDDASVAADGQHRVPVAGSVIVPVCSRAAGGHA